MTTPSERNPWLDLIPDVRGWATFGMFVLVFYVLTLIAFVPSVSESELFKTVATLLLGSGSFGLACAYLWGGSKATTGAIETVNAMARVPIPAPGTATVSAAPDVDVTIREADPAQQPPWERV